MSDANALRERALDLLVRGDTAGGITDLKAYLEAEPDDADAWLSLGTAYAAIEHLAQAAPALKTAVELDGQNVDARLAYARVLARSKKIDDAAFQLLQASKLAPDDARVWKELGLAFYDRKLFEKAANALRRACEVSPDDARAHYALGLAEEARHDMGAAVAAYREAVKREPAFVDARKTLADALAAMGEHEGAIAELTALLAFERSNEQAAHNKDVLERALADMQRSRLLGKGQKELEASALVMEGGFRKKGPVTLATAPNRLTIRYAAPLVELYASFDEAHAIETLLLMLTDPDRAAEADGTAFKVTVIAEDGRRDPVNFATAVTLTFLRESLGCPMTQASALYTRLLEGEPIEWGGASLGFVSVPRPDRPAETRHGLSVRRR
jgi:tetratricopeptide (TPR) repeat protein